MNPPKPPNSDIQRILALVPYLVAHPGAHKVDVAHRFGLSLEKLQADLDLVLMIGVPPFGGGDYIDVDDDGDRVTLRMADSFRRPVRLSPTEGLALLAAGRALLAVPGASMAASRESAPATAPAKEPPDPLAGALAKLEAALGSPEIVVALATPGELDVVRRAVDERRRLRLEYRSAGRDEVTERVVDPHAVFSAGGEWYLDAHCHRAGDDRLFRVDRIRRAELLDEHFVDPDDDRDGHTDGHADANPDGLARGDASDLATYRPRPDDTRVTLELAPGAHWVAERFPTEAAIRRDDGTLRVTLAITERAFLERLLLRLGPEARVVEPVAWRALAADPARRILDRYRGRST